MIRGRQVGDEGRRGRGGFLLIAVAAIAVILGVLVWALTRSDGGDNTSAAAAGGNPTAVATSTAATGSCERGDSFFELKYQKHTGGFVIDDGLPTNPEAATAKITVVAAQDPIVLRYFANEVLALEFVDDYGPIPVEKDLTVLQNRKEEWQRLCLFLTSSEVIVVIVQLEAGQIGNHVMDGNGNVAESDSQVAPGEQGIAIYKEGNHEQVVVLRAICSNLITKPPNDRPIVVPTATPTLRPGETPATPTNTPRPGSTPTTPAKKTPTWTPTRTPVKPTATPRPSTQTPAPTVTLVPPCCVQPPPTEEPTFVFIPSTPVRSPTATPTPVIATATMQPPPVGSPSPTPVSVW